MRHATAAAALGLGVVLLFGASCGGDGTPSSKNLVAPGSANVTITSSAAHLKVDETFTLAATARHQDGSTVPVTEWSSSNTGVATVDATSGRVSAVSAGKVSITAAHDGATQSTEVHRRRSSSLAIRSGSACPWWPLSGVSATT
jgi:hypothetical protein